MPGGLTSRACDACRQQKKKCDLKQPICGRCQVLKISCVNCNMQRWKLRHQSIHGSVSTSFSQAVVVRHACEAPIPHNLDSKNLRTASRLIYLCRTSNLGYDISVYGEYFHFIPRRLGVSQAFDAAVWAFVCAHPTLHTKIISTEALTAYGTAIRSVADSLHDDVQKKSPDILCALHLTNICQGWISRPSDRFFDYYAVMSHLLPDIIAQNSEDPFEYAQLIGSCIIMILTSMFSNKTMLNEEVLGHFLRRHRIARPHESSSSGKMTSFDLYQFLQLPKWIRLPTEHMRDMRDVYGRLQFDLRSLSGRTKTLASASQLKNGPSFHGRNKDDMDWRTAALERQLETKLDKTCARFQALASFFLCIAIFLNAVLRAAGDPFDRDVVLMSEFDKLVEEVL